MQNQLEKLADQILLEAGFATDGREKSEVDPRQEAFEKRFWTNAVGTAR